MECVGRAVNKTIARPKIPGADGNPDEAGEISPGPMAVTSTA